MSKPSRPLRRLCAALATLGVTLFPTAPVAAGGAGVGDLGSGPPARASRTAAPTNGIRWSDVPKKHWARTAIDFVGATNDWMRDFGQSDDGTYPFEPDAPEARRFFARALVRALVPDEAPDPSITFSDLSADDPFFPAANVAVKLGWIEAPGNEFRPDEVVTTTTVHRALVLALGLDEEATGLDDLHTRNGFTFDTPKDFGALLLGMRLGLRYNHADESLDVGLTTPLSRAEVAWSLYRAATTPSWTIDSLAPYATIDLPILGPWKRRIVQFGVQYVGYPYVYGGEWYQASPDGYCCGAQPVGGFDCSGLVWWVVKEATGGWDNVPPRDYAGWSLPQRSSADMASTGGKVKLAEIRAGDLLFYDGDGNGVVDHVNLYLGNGWVLDSSSGYGGVSILSVASGWYRDHFAHARRIIGHV